MREVVDTRWLFVRTCQDILRRTKADELYAKLRMAGLLHHLLIGPRALASLVNEDEGARLEFWYREPRLEDAQDWRNPRGFDASTQHGNVGEVKRAGLDVFLGARVAYLGDWFSVDQLIKAAAHVYGGYAGVVPEGLSNEAFAVFDRAVKEQGAAGVVPSALDEIAGVALRGLVPLAKSAESPAQRAKPEPMAPAGSGCPFGGKLNPDLFDG